MRCSAYAANASLKLNTQNIVTLDFKGGITYFVKESSADGMVVEVQGFRMEADLSPTTPNSGTIIVLALAENTLTPDSVIQSNGEMFIRLSLTDWQYSLPIMRPASGLQTSAPSDGSGSHRANLLHSAPPLLVQRRSSA